MIVGHERRRGAPTRSKRRPPGSAAARPIARAAAIADAKARIAAGSDRHRDPVQGRETALDLGDDTVDHRQKGFRMAALHDDRFRRRAAPSRPCRGRRPSRRQGSVDGEDAQLRLRLSRSGNGANPSSQARRTRERPLTVTIAEISQEIHTDRAAREETPLAQAALAPRPRAFPRNATIRTAPRARRAGSAAGGSGCRASGSRSRTGSPSRRPSWRDRRRRP